jgi:preprotein translocase subunit SecE
MRRQRLIYFVLVAVLVVIAAYLLGGIGLDSAP